MTNSSTAQVVAILYHSSTKNRDKNTQDISNGQVVVEEEVIEEEEHIMKTSIPTAAASSLVVQGRMVEEGHRDRIPATQTPSTCKDNSSLCTCKEGVSLQIIPAPRSLRTRSPLPTSPDRVALLLLHPTS